MGDFISWRKYATRAKGSIRPEFALASVANARYRVALGLRSMEIDGLSPSTADGYFQGLRVTLAYTAAEALAVAVDHHRFPINDAALAERFRDQRHADLDAMKRWVLTQNLKGHYSRGSSDTILSQDLAVLRSGAGASGLLESLQLQVGRLNVTPAELVGRSTNGGIFKSMFLAFRQDHASDWSSGVKISVKHGGKSDKLQFHHIFPRAILKPDFSKSEINDIANLAFIGGETNRRISATPPNQYLSQVLTSNPERLKAQQVPTDEGLYELSQYREFLEQRRQLIADRLNKFLGF